MRGDAGDSRLDFWWKISSDFGFHSLPIRTRSPNLTGVNTVQDIESALARLSPGELAEVEKSLLDLKQKQHESEGYDYLLREYGVTREEWLRFSKQRDRQLEDDREQGRMKLFTGDIEQDVLD